MKPLTIKELDSPEMMEAERLRKEEEKEAIKNKLIEYVNRLLIEHWPKIKENKFVYLAYKTYDISILNEVCDMFLLEGIQVSFIRYDESIYLGIIDRSASLQKTVFIMPEPEKKKQSFWSRFW